MSTDPTHIRLDTLESSIRQMSMQVGKVAEYMERLVVLEERNNFTVHQITEMRNGFKENMTELKTQYQHLETKFNGLNDKMIRLMTISSLLTGALAIAAPYIVKALMGT